MWGTHLYLLSNERAELFSRQLVGLLDVFGNPIAHTGYEIVRAASVKNCIAVFFMCQYHKFTKIPCILRISTFH